MIVIETKKISKYTNDLKSQTAIIAALADEIWHEHFPSVIGETQIDYMLKKFQSADRIYEDIISGGFTYFLAEREKGKEKVAYCAVKSNEDFMLLSKLYVKKDYRGMGVARSFLEEVSALCRECGLGKIRLTVNKHNSGPIAAYEKMGFRTVDSVMTDIGEGFFMDDYIMELRITVATADSRRG